MLSPFEDDKPKDAGISLFRAGSGIYCHAKHTRVEPHMVLEGKFPIILQKILQIYVSIIFVFSLSYKKIFSFKTLRP